MKQSTKSAEVLDRLLNERVKELNCIYRVEELLKEAEVSLDYLFTEIAKIIPHSWQYPNVCEALIRYKDSIYKSSDFRESPWVQRSEIIVQDTAIGSVEVYYLEEMPNADEGPFLKEERKLIDTIADRLGHFLLYRKLRKMFTSLHKEGKITKDKDKRDWRIIVDFIKRSDQEIYAKFSRKMMNYLCWNGVEEAKNLLSSLGVDKSNLNVNYLGESNCPTQKAAFNDISTLGDKIFEIAINNLSDNEILYCVQKWLQEDKMSFLVKTLENQSSSIGDIAEALTRFHRLAQEGIEFSDATSKTVNVSLILRFFTDQLEFLNRAKDYVDYRDFYDILQRIIFLSDSYGKLGGKSAGLFIAAKILNRYSDKYKFLSSIKVPKTWYITSDVLLSFLQYNNLEEVIEQKYKEIDQVRQEYPNIVQIFKNSNFPPDVVKELSVALDDLGDKPLIVRSSSLLEDRSGAAFSGKYKSLFLANQGTKGERLWALMDAISEVYASTFSPDPIKYRAERGLLDFHEEMGIMIEEVVGKKVGKYFMPAFAGVAFSNNEFRWSPRIKREDGLIRMVTGLGTRAVDRLSDDYPILIAPGQPGLRVNVTPDEAIRYSPSKIDVINLKANTFETIEIRDLLKEYGDQYPKVKEIFSIVEDGEIRQFPGLQYDFKKDQFVVTFEGLIQNGIFVKQIKTALDVLKEELGTPVDIEFASDGDDLYILQCRSQSDISEVSPSPIPRNIPERDIIFSANRYISNGWVSDVTHIVYVVPEKYSEIQALNDMKAVGVAIGRINSLLPKKQFILMGPGRWGSRGDIKLGVSVTYSDINNTAALIEIARKKGNYLPDLSFGTHFFQDLVEDSIRYLPLYPDDNDITFNESFLMKSPNILPEILPEYKYLSDVIRIVDIPRTTNGRILRILMNADLNEAIGFLAKPRASREGISEGGIAHKSYSNDYWQWRIHMAKQIAEHLDPERFGVKKIYITGSTKNAIAGPGSDIDLIVHFVGNDSQKEDLLNWFEGWSLSLGEMNYLRTGYKVDKLLDVHIITDEDIENKTSFAIKIGAVTDAAKELPLKISPK